MPALLSATSSNTVEGLEFSKQVKSHDSEKLESVSVGAENVEHDGVAGEAGGFDRTRLEKRLVRKLDARFAILIIIYILNYIDRNNISAARTKGLEVDLKLTGSQYPTLLSILYVGYILMQVPSNMIVKKMGRPSIYLPLCMAIWGLISALTGITTTFIGALLTRFFLGFVEASFFPGSVFLLSSWYKKDEMGLRTAILFCGSLISNAFGPLMAAGILANMEGSFGGREAWRNLFFIEAIITVAVALLAVPILPDFPHNSRGFSQAERNIAMQRMSEDVGVEDEIEVGAFRSLLDTLLDPKAWAMALTLTALVVGLSFNQFFPTLTKTLGYSNTVSLLLCAPPFFFATLCAFFVGRHSDKTQERAMHIIVPVLIGILGCIIAMSTEAVAARYVSLFLLAQTYAGFVVFYAWISNTFPRPAMKRGIAIAFINAFSQLGNISGAYTYPKNWGPSYVKSFGIVIAMFSTCIAGVLFHRFTLGRLNRKLVEAEARGESCELSGVKLPKGFRYVL
ncbi:BQ5605_C004g02608 [Microbotryum silenes-dioicae]|uniref:BQ5605_C004g02608 protein n=1 Tax=Microbotryum silenes-dioicae TaxID=796604 RepID=A0A2X0MCR5_9BASI|nr:BQ5605_C004g02608 [Microbotryum silenes-dioicae]